MCAEATPDDEARRAVETIRDRCRAVEVDPAIGACKWVSWTSVRLVDDVRPRAIRANTPAHAPS